MNSMPTIDQGQSFDRFVKLLFPQYITQNTNALRVWIYMLQHVTPLVFDPAHQPMPRGQFCITQSTITEELDLTEECVSDSFKLIEPYAQSQRKEVNGTILYYITIPHYDFYLQFFGSNED